MNNQEENNGFQILTKYFLDNFSIELLLLNQRIPQNWVEGRGKFYFEKLMELSAVIEKVERYEIYFSEFYPSSKNISKAEAIEYHWHSYIHDLYILQERIVKLVGSLKNDIPRYEIANSEEIKLILEHLKKQAISGLKSAHEARTTLSHDFTLRDLNLVKAKALKILETQDLEFKIDPQKINEKYRNLTQESKEKYIQMAKHNAEEIKKMKSFFALRFGYVFASLNRHDPSIFGLF